MVTPTRPRQERHALTSPLRGSVTAKHLGIGGQALQLGCSWWYINIEINIDKVCNENILREEMPQCTCTYIYIYTHVCVCVCT